jgi:mRNA-degrading endonuclease YafQ of YafQ-DinJ toxin-antitoxin module
VRKLDIRKQFEADVRRVRRQRVKIDWETLDQVFQDLVAGDDAPEMLRPHALHSGYAGFREFHLEEDTIA